MQTIQHQEPVPPTEPALATTSRLRTVTGSRWPRKCACGCGLQIPRDPEVRYVVDFGAPKPYPAYLREHSPDYGTYRGKPRATENARTLPGFTPASELPRPEPPKPPVAPRPAIEVAHEDAETTASPEAGRAWASGQLVFNAGSFESARSGFADYARDGESAKELRARVNRKILEDLEAKVLALERSTRSCAMRTRGRRSAISWRGRGPSLRCSERGPSACWEGSVFEFRLRILDVRERETDPNSFLGIVEGFPEILVHATTVEQVERDLVNALEEHFSRLMDHEATRLELDDFPTVRVARLCLSRACLP